VVVCGVKRRGEPVSRLRIPDGNDILHTALTRAPEKGRWHKSQEGREVTPPPVELSGDWEKGFLRGGTSLKQTNSRQAIRFGIIPGLLKKGKEKTAGVSGPFYLGSPERSLGQEITLSKRGK